MESAFPESHADLFKGLKPSERFEILHVQLDERKNTMIGVFFAQDKLA